MDQRRTVPMTDFKTVGLVARVANDQVRESLLRVEAFLRLQGVELVYENATADMLGLSLIHI